MWGISPNFYISPFHHLFFRFGSRTTVPVPVVASDTAVTVARPASSRSSKTQCGQKQRGRHPPYTKDGSIPCKATRDTKRRECLTWRTEKPEHLVTTAKMPIYHHWCTTRLRLRQETRSRRPRTTRKSTWSHRVLWRIVTSRQSFLSQELNRQQGMLPLCQQRRSMRRQHKYTYRPPTTSHSSRYMWHCKRPAMSRWQPQLLQPQSPCPLPQVAVPDQGNRPHKQCLSDSRSSPTGRLPRSSPTPLNGRQRHAVLNCSRARWSCSNRYTTRCCRRRSFMSSLDRSRHAIRRAAFSNEPAMKKQALKWIWPGELARLTCSWCVHMMTDDCLEMKMNMFSLVRVVVDFFPLICAGVYIYICVCVCLCVCVRLCVNYNMCIMWLKYVT